MNTDFLTPIDEKAFAYKEFETFGVLGERIQIYSYQNNFPNLENITIAIFGVKEGRNAFHNDGCGDDLYLIRNKFYELFPGNWNVKIADIGNIEAGDSVEDTYFAVSEVISSLVKKNIIPVIIGGSQDLTYANYRAYDNLEQTVNLVSVDSRFDLGTLNSNITSTSFLSKIIMEKPNNLFNFSNIGYQTYFNSQEEINLLQKMYFDAYRLGAIKKIELVEPILRDADIVSIDIGSIRQSEAPANGNASPNGLYGEDICAIARYAGISDKVTSFGVYEYNSSFDENQKTASLIAQMIWYFIEGVNNRAKDYPFITKEKYQKFIVLLEDDEPITFYKSDKSGRWWMEINLILNNKNKRHTLIPCSYEDYMLALEHKIPERWYKALQKII